MMPFGDQTQRISIVEAKDFQFWISASRNLTQPQARSPVQEVEGGKHAIMVQTFHDNIGLLRHAMLRL